MRKYITPDMKYEMRVNIAGLHIIQNTNTSPALVDFGQKMITDHRMMEQCCSPYHYPCQIIIFVDMIICLCSIDATEDMSHCVRQIGED